MNNLYVEQRDDAYRVANTRVSFDSVVMAFLQGLSFYEKLMQARRLPVGQR